METLTPKDFLQKFMDKHGILHGYIWRKYELMKLMVEYEYYCRGIESQKSKK